MAIFRLIRNGIIPANSYFVHHSMFDEIKNLLSHYLVSRKEKENYARIIKLVTNGFHFITYVHKFNTFVSNTHHKNMECSSRTCQT